MFDLWRGNKAPCAAGPGHDVEVIQLEPVRRTAGVVATRDADHIAIPDRHDLVHAAAIGEAMVLAKRAGLEPDLWWEVMKGGAADSFVMQHDVPSIFAGHYDPSFRLALALKDLDLIQDLVAEHGTRSELTEACHARFREAAERYGSDAGEMTVCKLIEEDADVSLQVAGKWTAPWEAAPA